MDFPTSASKYGYPSMITTRVQETNSTLTSKSLESAFTETMNSVIGHLDLVGNGHSRGSGSGRLHFKSRVSCKFDWKRCANVSSI